MATLGGFAAPKPRGSIGAGGGGRINDPHDIARKVSEITGYKLSTSINSWGRSAYIQTPFGDVRISDHPTGEFRRSTEPLGYEVDPTTKLTAEDIASDIMKRAEAAKIRAKQRQEQQERERQAEVERKRPAREMHEGNRQEKLRFFEKNGLVDATETQKKKAWKAFLRGRGVQG